MGFHPFVLVVSFVLFGAAFGVGTITQDPIVAAAIAGVALLLPLSIRVARQWQQAVVLRLGRFSGLRGPGAFMIVPFLDTIPFWIDLRVVSTPFNAEQTLTKDTVPVDVDAVLFWRVVDPRKAALEVEVYKEAIFWAAQTALRDVIGKTDLSKMLAGREELDDLLRNIIHHRTEAWGIQVVSVEIRDVKIPASLQDAMSMQAQAGKEREARVILADSERMIAESFRKSAESYASNPEAIHLRALNILLEGMRHNSTIVVVPSSAVQTMGVGGIAGITSIGADAAARRALSAGSKPQP